jgi:processive 1,2-diacylglycerol beta-glucosyltransferase
LVADESRNSTALHSLALARNANHHSAMRILITTVTAGNGHLAAASALEEAWRAVRPSDAVERIDLCKFFSPLHRRIHANGYVKLVERAPELWGMLFAKTDDPKVARRINRVQRLFPSRSRSKFAHYVNSFKPEAVLCTHYAALSVLGCMRREQPRWRAPLVVSVVTDFEAHALWMDEDVDMYCVAAEETKARLVARGAGDGNILPTGIPIAAKFSAKIDETAVRRTLGLRDDLPTLLVLSGGFGMGPVGKILSQLDKVSHAFQTLVVCGRNEELRRELAAQDRNHPTRVLGFASNMHELMAVADLIVSKPGGLTSSEALAMGKPLLILDPIPGQEAANSDFLLERGAAVKVNRVEDVPHRVGQLLSSKKLEALAKAAKKLGRANAGTAICREVLRRIEIS